MGADAPGMAPDSGPKTLKRPRLLSPSRLNDFLGCEHRTYLDLLHERGEIADEERLQPDAELLLERREELATGAPPAYPYPVEDCDFCPWWKRCADRRRDEDHLSLVALLQRNQGLRLEAIGVHSVTELAALPEAARVPRMAGATL